jgi:hypothetical protein
MAEDIKINLRADSKPLRAEFGKAQKSVKSFGKDATDSLKRLAAFGAGLLGLRAGLGVLSNLRDEFDRIGKLSAQFDLPVETVQKLKLAAELTGSDLEKLVGALRKATVAGTEAGDGLETYVRQFRALGINVEEFNRAAPDQKLAILADAFANATDQSAAFTAAYRILGRSGAELIPLLKGGADGIKDISENLETLDAGQIKAIEDFNDQLTVLKTNLQAGLANAFSEEDLEKLVDALSQLGVVLGNVTSFIARNGDALAGLVKLYVGYRVALKAISFVPLLKGLAMSATAFRTSTGAITSQTAAINANTAAKSRNAGIKMGGASGALGAAGLALAIPEFFKLGEGIGNDLFDKLSDAEGKSRERAERAEEERKILAEYNREATKRESLDENALENARFRAQVEKETAEARAKNAKIREERQAALKSELAAMAKQVLEVEVSFLAPEEQLAKVQSTVEQLSAAAERIAERAGLETGGDTSPRNLLRLGANAGNAGQLSAGKQLLQVAQKMREATDRRAELEARIAEDRARQAEAARMQAQDEERQARQKRDLAVELKALQLEASGRGEMAERLREEFDLRKEAARLAEETGMSEERALALLQERNRLEKQISDRRRRDNDLAEIVARGSFKLSPKAGQEFAGQRLRGVPDIGRAGIGNAIRRQRDGERAAAGRQRVGEANTAKYFEQLIQKSESLLEIWRGLNAV